MTAKVTLSSTAKTIANKTKNECVGNSVGAKQYVMIEKLILC